MSILLKQVGYVHSDGESLFQNIDFSIQRKEKAALIGNNGSGKSVLLQILSGKLIASSGSVVCSSIPYYVPQHFGQYGGVTVAEALRIDKKVESLKRILAGKGTVNDFVILDDDWSVEERAVSALSFWGMEKISLSCKLNTLSGGEKTSVFLAGIQIHSPEIILLDEPTNHLDAYNRKRLYDFVCSSSATMVVVSHDRTLLNLFPITYELECSVIKCYGGNYEFYRKQKDLEKAALHADLEEQKKEFRLAKKIAIEVIERKQKQNIRAPKNAKKAGMGKMAMNTMKSKSEKRTSRLEEIHEDKLNAIIGKVNHIRNLLPDEGLMKTNILSSSLHIGKILVSAQNINWSYSGEFLWKEPLTFQIKSGDRLSVRGKNGTGKTTLLKLITGVLQPIGGIIKRAEFKYLYLDQEYSIVKNTLSVFDQVKHFSSGLSDDMLKIILSRFLFPHDTWNKDCAVLSGGEKMRLSLCCLMVSENMPDMLILDEPTNNIDVRNMDILLSAVRNYKGTILLVSHDEYFVRQVNVGYFIDLDV